MTYEKNGLYIDEGRLEAFAENRARSFREVSEARTRFAAAPVTAALRELQRAHDALELKWNGVPAAPGAVRWLLDNFWLAKREGAAAAAELRRARLRQSGKGESLLSALCAALLRSGLGELTETRMALFLRGWQREMALEGEELRLFPAMLRAVLIEALSRVFRAPEAESAEQTAAKLFTALRFLSSADLTALLEKSDRTEQALRDDPAGVYPRMARSSREAYRARLARLARGRGISEHAAARRVLELAQAGAGAKAHVGWWIFRAPLGDTAGARTGGAYIAANVLITLFFALLTGFLTRSAAVAALLLIPLSEAVKHVLDYALLHAVKPVHLPRLALKEGVPPEGRTLCAVSALLTDAKDARALARRLEALRLLSRDAGEELRFALLADLPDAPEKEQPGDAETLAAAKGAIDALNEKYGGGFYLLTRPRTKTPEGAWSGWERKPAALLETMRALRALPGGISVAAGDAPALEGTKFLLALDSDTRLSPGAARELIGAMLHPLNAPELDMRAGVVRGGFGILAPRIGVELAAAGRSDFARVFAGQGGTDPYGCACSDLGMDLWGRGSFAGKGIIDVDAYLACMGRRVPENRMLSHDAVEGAFLRAGWCGDVELTDGWPGSALSYYARLERWTRGDWQNLPWLFRPGRALPDIEKWKLFDSLRRSLTPLATLFALLLGFFRPALGVAAAAALLALLSELLLTAADAMLQRDGARTKRFHSALFLGVGGSFVRTLLRLLLLPAEAFVCIAAALRALWRMGVSKRRLLQWRTAAQSEKSRQGLFGYYTALWFPPLCGLALLLAAPSVIGKAAGFLWVLTPMCAWLLSLPAYAPPRLNAAERESLRAWAGDTYRYFADFMTSEDHFLPPDNYQDRPPTGLARRTSPTNIGLGLLSLLAAADLKLTEPAEALGRIAESLKSVEALEKWRGHLLNWYDTATLQPLAPKCVSTVDSGNLCACLLALGQGLREYDRPDLAARAEALAAAMNFAPLYDKKRRLFFIAYDVEENAPTGSWYDLLSSEARLTAYLAVARGDVPREHWRQLSRAQVAEGRYRGMVSWTGTMFEYLMPELLLPLQRDSLLYESAKFCLYVQRRRAKRAGAAPWGASESAYGALDSAMNYRYKAHGCAHLALKRGMDDELVISPYSSFLALSVEPHAAIRNLRRLAQYGMRCDYGFWEALDFSYSRLYQADPHTVRCVMAHHEGMSLVQCANTLLDGIMRRRFLTSPAMGAYTGLLEEKVPAGGDLLRRAYARSAPARPRRETAESWRAEGAGTDYQSPRCCLLAGDAYSLLIAETGLTRALWGAVSPYVPPASPLDAEKGVDLFLETEDGVFPLLPRPDAPPDIAYSWRFTDAQSEHAAVGSSLSARVLTAVAAGDVGERREVRLSNAGDAPVSLSLALRFRPLLARRADYESHPAFWGLGVSARTQEGCLLLRRLPREGSRELWMCLAPSLPCEFDLNPGAAGGRSAETLSAPDTELFLTDPLLTARCALRLAPGEHAGAVFALAMAYRPEDALAAARRILREGRAADTPRLAAALVGLKSEDVEAANALLPLLCFPTAPAGTARQEDLWPAGISGDLPIVCAGFSDAEALPWAQKLMDMHLFLTGCGADFDLVFLSRDAAGYGKPLRDALSEALWRRGGEALRDSRGGVHILEDGPAARPVYLSAALCLRSGEAIPIPPRRTGLSVPRLPLFPAQSSDVSPVWEENGAFSFRAGGALPRRAWQNVLSNGRFGFLATDCGTGNMWYLNAREMQLSPWLCRPRATAGPEGLLLERSGEYRSLFAAPDGRRCTVRYLPGTAVWETERARVTAFVPPDIDARVLLIEPLDTAGEDLTLHWRLDLLLAGRPDAARFCRTVFGGGFLAAENPRGLPGTKPFLALATGRIREYTFSRASAMALSYDEAQPEGEPVFAARLPLRGPLVLVCGCASPDALWPLTEPETARGALERTAAHWKKLLSALALRSPEPGLDRLFNGWLGYQALAGRMLARCSLYQSGGAWGFRDQLQDAVNLIALDPSLARAQILRCCARQYSEGDVQHWWHEGGAEIRGVRTRCSDDLLWLPWALCEYLERTGDEALCRSSVPYLSSPPLGADERDRYEAAAVTDSGESVFRHCLRALLRVMERGTGPHGLLWIGSGDWNDGLSAVDGESVWLSWFFLLVCRSFLPLLARMGKDGTGLAAFCDALAASANAAWDGNWFLRGWYAHGAPLGSAENAECRVDAIAQSFAVLSGRAEEEKAGRALSAAIAQLFDREHGLVRLFSPPFAGAEKPGYIASYGPGFRENGGQYTHGALWLVLALLRAGRTDEGWELLRALLPADKSLPVYEAEPYVLSADVYAAAGHEGEAGWSWYTGAAGWMLRIVAEELLGLRMRGGRLYIEPKLPTGWSGYRAVYHGHRISCGSEGISVDGVPWNGNGIPLGKSEKS